MLPKTPVHQAKGVSAILAAVFCHANRHFILISYTKLQYFHPKRQIDQLGVGILFALSFQQSQHLLPHPPPFLFLMQDAYNAVELERSYTCGFA
ncbi:MULTISPECIES: hypothetical protein [Bifidobacterium]|jgi:hypothetical protein|uniref:hypothetical protein n=1 Tax=Bifidobacterium TaxID=1678 RepID=UPI0012B698F4|nr:hypothetical protein [Bifidobacterium tibiigranuli]MCI1212282.1 hypothetical protein [Bifidobacterium tibiigranuli]MCI1221505.1 hypothetical protein [Bifidobacterium tibiigranuli]